MFFDYHVFKALNEFNYDVREALYSNNREGLLELDLELVKWLCRKERGRWSWIVYLSDPDKTAVDDFCENSPQSVDEYDSEYVVRWSFEKLNDALGFKLTWM